MTFLMPQQLLASVLEKIMNTALSLNVNENDTFGVLTQKTIEVHLSELGFPLCFTVEQETILVTALTERSDCVLTTSLSTLSELQKTLQLTELIKQNKLDITGDLKVAQQFATLFENLTIDWQSEIAKHIGDIPTYKLGQFSLRLKDKFNFTTEQIKADSTEWLVHEKRLVVTKSQISDFCAQVSDVSDQANLIEQRMIALSNKLTDTAST